MIKQLGKYMIMEQIGKGSMGQVYKARDQNIGRIAAIKTIKLPDSSDSEKKELIRRFKQEAMAAGNLNHPNIVVIYEYDELDNVAYIAMEYIEGVELKSYFDANEVFAQNRIIEIMTQLLDALEYSHRRGVIHRDIKPSNIMITPSGQVKVTDFGIARLESSELTQAGSTLGTPSYMSPEQCTGQAVDARSDIFSTGVVLYQLLTGDKPFTGPSITAILHKITQVSPPPPSKLNFGISPGFDPILEKCLAKRPEDRFANAAELSTALTALADTAESGDTRHREDVAADEDKTTFIEPISEDKFSPAPHLPEDEATIAVPLGNIIGTDPRDQLLNDATVYVPSGRQETAPPADASNVTEKQQPDNNRRRTSSDSFRWLNRYTYLGGTILLLIFGVAVFMMKGNPLSPSVEEAVPLPATAQSIPTPEESVPQKTDSLSIGQHTQIPEAEQQEEITDAQVQAEAEKQAETDTPSLVNCMIVSDPPGASVELEPRGLLDSITPLEIQLPSGSHQLYIKKEGYHDMSLMVEVQESNNNQLQLKLLPM